MALCLYPISINTQYALAAITMCVHIINNTICIYLQVKTLTLENEQLFEGNERAKKLHEELTDAESRCSEYEAKVCYIFNS